VPLAGGKCQNLRAEMLKKKRSKPAGAVLAASIVSIMTPV
jgi:hypothetical protein